MAVTDQQKLDFLLKKIGYTKTKTGSVVGTGAISGTPKQPFAEAIPSPLVVANSSLWNEADSIPATPPVADTTQVKVYLAATSGLRMTADATSSGQRAYIAYSTYNNTSSTRLTNWIDTQFGASYIIKVYKGDPNSGGVALSAAGSGANDGWFFDYSAGVLNFNDTSVPSGVTDTNIYIVGYRYIGQTGAPTSGISTFSYLDLTVERNLDVGVQGGISTFRNNIDANGIIEGIAGENKIPFLYSNLAALPNAGTYHGMFAHVHSEGRGYFAHAGNWLELVNKDTSGNVGLSGDLDVDGHTNLDNVSISGVTTMSGNLSLESTYPRIFLKDTNHNPDFSILNNDGNLGFRDDTNGEYRLQILGTGETKVYHNLIVDKDLDVDGHTNLDNISVAGVSTFTGDATFSGNVSIGGTLTYEDVTNVDSVGLLTARSGIRVTGGVIEALAGENKIPSLYANMAALPSASTYHGMFAHVHATQKGYFAHGGAWYELVNKELNGRVGTGTESYFIDRLVSTSTTATSLNVTGVTTAVTVDINGDLDVDGHTNLDNVSISGVTTITSTTYPLVVHADTGYQGILVNGNNAPTIGFNIGNNTTPSWKLGLHGNSHLNFALSTGTGNSNKLVIQDASNGGKGLFYGDWYGANLSMAGSLYHDGDTDTMLQFGGAEDIINLRTGGVTRLSVQNSGIIVTGVSTFSSNIDANGDLDVDGHTELDNVNISGVTTFPNTGKVLIGTATEGHANADDLTVATTGTTGITIRSGDTSNGNIYFSDATSGDGEYRGYVSYNHSDDSLKLGTAADNRIIISAAGYVKIGTNVEGYAGAPNLTVASTGNCGVTIRSGASNQGTIAFSDAESGAGEYDGFLQYSQANRELKVGTASAVRFTVTSGGHVVPYVDSTYDLGTTSKRWRNLYADNIVSAPGNGFIGPDLTVRNLKATGLSTFVGQSEFDGNAKFDSTITAGGGTGTNGQYLKTTGSGVAWATFPALRTRDTQTASAGQTSFPFNYNVGFVDVFVNGVKLTDSEFTATNGTSIVLAVGSFVGDIVELVSYNTVSAGGGASGIGNVVEDTTPQLGGNLDLFSKTINGTGGINITGVVTATTFIGDGSGLTGIVASGAGGVVIKDSGSTVGTAGTIDFGDNLSVSPINAGIVTITSGVTTSQFNVNNLDVSGITTISGITTFSDTVHFAYNPGTSADKFWFWGNGTDRYAVFRRENISSPAFNLSNLTRLTLGSSQQSEIVSENSQATFIRQYTTSSNNPLKIESDFSNFVGSPTSSHSSRKIADFEFLEGCSLYYTGTKRLQTSGIGITVTGSIVASGDLDVDGHTELDNVNIAGVVTATTFKGALEATSGSFSSNIDANGDLDVDGHTNLDNVSVAGVSTFNNDVHLGLHGAGNPKIHFDESGDLLWFKKATAGGSSTKIWLGGGTSYDNLQLQQTYTSGGQSEITTRYSHLFLATNDAAKNITLQSANDILLTNSSYPGLKVLKNGVNNGAALSVELYWGSTNSAGGTGGKKLETDPKGIKVGTGVTVETNGQATYTGIVTALKFVGDGSSLTNVSAAGINTTNVRADTLVVGENTTGVSTFHRVNIPTNKTMFFGNTNQASLSYQTSGYLYMYGGIEGDMVIQTGGNRAIKMEASGNFEIDTGSNEIAIKATKDGPVELYQNGYGAPDGLRFATTGVGVTVIGITSMTDNLLVGTAATITPAGAAQFAGIVTANSFVGDGSGLTGITASGTGVVIKEGGTTVGTAGTINFVGVDVSPASAGIVTVSTATTSITDGNSKLFVNNVSSSNGNGSFEVFLNEFTYGGTREALNMHQPSDGYARVDLFHGSTPQTIEINAKTQYSGNARHRLKFESTNSGYGGELDFITPTGSWNFYSTYQNTQKNVISFNYNSIGVGNYMYPITNNAFDLGTSSYKWRQFHTTGVNAGVVTATTYHGDGSNLTGIGGSQNLFQTIAVSGQSNVVADSATDTLTLVAGSNMTITTNASSDTITFASSGGSSTPAYTDVQVAYELTNSSSSGNGWRINGNGFANSTGNPDIYLTRGQKYRFINNSGGSHPFRIQSDASTAYNTGVTNNNSTSGNIDFIPQNNAPAKLYYNCTAHGGMLGNIYIIGEPGRDTASATTSSIANNAAANITINAAKTYALLKIQTSAAAWVTLYTDSTSRSNDSSRNETTDPTPGSGVIAEVITSGAATQIMTPGLIGWNNDGTVSTNVYAKVVNKSGSTGTITVTLTYVHIES